MRRNYGDAAAHDSTHNTQDHTHIHTNISNRRSMEEGVDGVVRARVEDASLAGSTGHGFRAARAGQPKTYRHERTREGEPEPKGGRAALDCVSTTFRYAHAKKKAAHTYIYLN